MNNQNFAAYALTAALSVVMLACGQTKFTGANVKDAPSQNSSDAEQNAALDSSDSTNGTDIASVEPEVTTSPSATTALPQSTSILESKLKIEQAEAEENTAATPTPTPAATATGACPVPLDSTVAMAPELIASLLSGVEVPYRGQIRKYKAVPSASGSIAIMDFAAAGQACATMGGQLDAGDYYIILGRQVRSQLLTPPACSDLGVWHSRGGGIDMQIEHSTTNTAHHMTICLMP